MANLLKSIFHPHPLLFSHSVAFFLKPVKLMQITVKIKRKIIAVLLPLLLFAKAHDDLSILKIQYRTLFFKTTDVHESTPIVRLLLGIFFHVGRFWFIFYKMFTGAARQIEKSVCIRIYQWLNFKVSGSKLKKSNTCYPAKFFCLCAPNILNR